MYKLQETLTEEPEENMETGQNKHQIKEEDLKEQLNFDQEEQEENQIFNLGDLGNTGNLGENWEQPEPRQPVFPEAVEHQDAQETGEVEELHNNKENVFLSIVNYGDTGCMEYDWVQPIMPTSQPPGSNHYSTISLVELNKNKAQRELELRLEFNSTAYVEKLLVSMEMEPHITTQMEELSKNKALMELELELEFNSIADVEKLMSPTTPPKWRS